MKPRRRWRLPSWPTLLLLACAASAGATPQFELADAALAREQVLATRQLLDEAASRLPPVWRQALDTRITVEWRDDLPAHVHGRALGRRMLLRRALLDGWMARDAAAAGSDDPAARPALAAVVHELAHFYDRSARGRLSRDPRLLDLAGWQVRPFRLLPRLGDNAFTDRSPDPYELTDPSEFVAVNLEHFVLDPAYACRRPALYRHFSAHFDHAPPQDDCAPGLVYLQPDDEGERSQPEQAALLQLDPERVLEIDYLLAEGNERFMSRWGHSMLRLVVCAPGRPRGPDCRLDLQHHRVLSFRAFVDDVQISNWRGLTGSYPSRLFLLPLDQVIEEYTRVELRGLRSLPLRLERGEIAALLERAAQLHWSYDGRYYFIGNNCAVETFKLLHDGVPRLAGERLAGITPTGLLRRLERAAVVDTAVLDDAAEAVRLGYYFEPASAHYRDLFETARHSLDLPQPRVEDWLDLPPRERTPWLRRADLRTGAALLVLERAALRRQELLARDELKRRFLGRDADPQALESGALAALHELLRLEGLLTRPAALLDGPGYGLPQAEERAALLEAGERHLAQWREHGGDLRAEANRWLPPQRQAALADGEANLALLGERLRELHRDEGGLRL